MQDGATGMLTDIEQESSLDGSEMLPQDSGNSWLTGHQEPMSWSLRSASGVMPEVEEVTRVPVTQQGFDHHPHNVGENVGLDEGLNDTGEDSTWVSLHGDGASDDSEPTEPKYDSGQSHYTEPTETNNDSSQTLEATHGEAVWSMAVANALVDWGIAGSFQYSTKTRQLGLSAQRHARYGYILLLTLSDFYLLIINVHIRPS